MIEQQKPCLRAIEEDKKNIQGKRFQIVGLTSSKGSSLNGKTGTCVGVQYEPSIRTLIQISGDTTIYKIKPCNLFSEELIPQTIDIPYNIMTLSEGEEIDKLIAAALKSPKEQKDWKLRGKQVGPQTTQYIFQQNGQIYQLNAQGQIFTSKEILDNTAPTSFPKLSGQQIQSQFQNDPPLPYPCKIENYPQVIQRKGKKYLLNPKQAAVFDCINGGVIIQEYNLVDAGLNWYRIYFPDLLEMF